LFVSKIFRKFLSSDEVSWTAAYAALCWFFNDRKTHKYMQNASSFDFLLHQQVFSLLQRRQMTTIDVRIQSDDFEMLLNTNSGLDEFLWFRQLVCSLLHNPCVDSSILAYLRKHSIDFFILGLCDLCMSHRRIVSCQLGSRSVCVSFDTDRDLRL